MRNGHFRAVAGLLTLLFWVAACGGEAEEQGGSGQPCFDNETCVVPFVRDDGVCAMSNEEQGGLGEPCYSNQTCDAPYVCEEGACVESGGGNRGGLGGPCYANQTCDAPYVCEEGTCVEDDPSPPPTTVRALRDDTDHVCTWSSGLPSDSETYLVQDLVAVSPIYNVTSGTNPLRGFFAEQDPSAGDRTFGGILVTFREADNSGLELTDIVPGAIVDVTRATYAASGTTRERRRPLLAAKAPPLRPV